MPTTDPGNLAAVFKAYDVRGTVPDQIDERPRARGRQRVRAVDRTAGRRRSWSATTCAPPRPGMARAFAEGAGRGRRRRDPDRAGLHRRALLRLGQPRACPGRCSPRATTPRSTTASRCAGRRAVTDRRGDRARRDPRPGRGGETLRRASGPATISRAATCSATTRRTCARSRRCAGRRLQGGGRRRQRHGRAHRAGGARAGSTLELVPLYFELDGTFPNHEANPIDPANLVDLQAKVRETGADIGLAFDGDADRCFLVDERGELVSPVGAHRADRRPRAGQGPRARRSSTT